MKRKILSLILVFAMTVSLLTVGTGAVEPTYGDTAGHWAESSIERWSGHGIIQGSNGLFDPNGQLTCAQLATILAKLLKLPAAKDAGFTDNTADAWYYDAVNRCAAAGILNGNGDSTVTPEAPITRERAMVMLARALGIEPIRKPDLTKYTDAAKVAPYAQGMVAAMIEAGIVGGVTADELAPQDNINRASTVTILDRAIGTYANEAGATVKAASEGITLVVADDVTITGSAESVLVAQGALDGTVTLSSSSAGSVTVTAENATVYVTSESKADDVTLTETAVDSKVVVLKGAQVGTVTTAAPGSTVSVSGKVDTVTTTATAEKASVEVAKNATVGEIAASGEKTEIAVSGKVDSVTVADTAADTTVKANSGSTISKVDNAAEGTTVSGSGKVENVTTSGDNTTVSTPGTKVEASEGTSGTTAGGKDVVGGESTTTKPSTPSGGGSSSGGSSHSHSHTYTDNGDGTHTGKCYANDSTLAPAAHTYTGGKCTACGVEAENKAASVKNAEGVIHYYDNLTDAVAKAGAGDTVYLLKDVTVEGEIAITDGKDVLLDLNGHNIVSNNYYVFNVCNAKFHVTGTGSIFENVKNGYAPIIARGSNTDVENYTVITIDEKVTLKGDYAGIFVGKDSADGYNNYGLVINMKGTIDMTAFKGQEGAVSAYGVYVNGTNAQITGNIMQINLDGTKIMAGDEGIYAAGYAKWNLNNCTIDAGNTAVEIRAGEMTINGGAYTATADSTKTEANGNGSTTVGAAVAVVQHTTKLPIDVKIQSGTFTAKTALVKQFPETDPNEKIVKLSVTGGTFNDLANALQYAVAGAELKLANDCTVTETINIAKDITIDGQNNTLTAYSGGPTIKITGSVDVCLKNLTIGSESYTHEDGIQAITSADSKLSFENVNITNAFKAIHFSDCKDTAVSIKGCTLTSVYPFNVNGGNVKSFVVEDSSLNGWTSFSNSSSNQCTYTFKNTNFGKGNGYATVKPYSNTTFEGCTFSADYFKSLEGGIASGTNTPITVKFNDCFMTTSDGATQALTVDLLKTAFNYDITSGSSSGDSTIDDQYWYVNGEKIALATENA